jgi:hypothetical protein
MKGYQRTDGMWRVDPDPRRLRRNRDILKSKKFKP